MADSSTILVIDQVDPLDKNGREGPELVRAIQNQFRAAQGGGKRIHNVRVWADGAAPRVAFGTCTLATGSGAQTIVINGVTAGSETWATSDTATMTALVADINASTDALVQHIVRACNLSMGITLASVAAGDYVDICGYRFTAVARAAVLGEAEFSQTGTDTQDATSLAAQINARAGLNQLVLATSSSGVVSVRQLSGTTSAGNVFKSGSGITLSASSFSAGVTGLISAIAPGVLGNCVTLAVTGTGHSASGSRLANGTGGAVSAITCNL